MLGLLPHMVERMGLIVTIAFLMTRLKSFRRMIQQDLDIRDKIVMMTVFGLFGIISTYTGIVVSVDKVVSPDWIPSISPDDSIANTRNLGVVIGGLLGGPAVGLGIGIIAGLHRYTLGGFTGFACMISTIAGGLISGWVGRRYRGGHSGMIKPSFAVLVGMTVEIVQMIIILLIAKPYSAALHLIEFIGLPMIIVNGFGVMIFVLIIHSVLREEERARALQTQKALSIADRTLPFFRQGLNVNSCREAARIIYDMTDADAISITDTTQVLAHIGAGDDHHRPHQNLATELTRSVLEVRKIVIAHTREEIGCFQAECLLQAAVVLPLLVHGEAVGTLKLYFKNPHQLSAVEQELAEGLAKLFSTQLELAEAEKLRKLLRDAEIKALQAQVHPHFLFNAINTIVALCRTDVNVARKLLLNLGAFFRSNLQGAQQMLVPLSKELEHVQSYWSLEEARFPGRFSLSVEIDPELSEVSIPPFTLQPLVENSIRHGFPNVREGGCVFIRFQRCRERLDAIEIRVGDNGAGVAADKLALLGEKAVKSDVGTGTALHNIRQRLLGLYGQEAAFHIESRLGEGTVVTMMIPLMREGGGA